MEMVSLYGGLLIGLLGGVHCFGMCGAIALTIGANRTPGFMLQNLSYQIGRAVSYAFLGALLGLLGKAMHLAGLQQGLSVFIGVVLIVGVLLPQTQKHTKFLGKPFQKLHDFVRKNIGPLLRATDYRKRFVLGLLNGLIPCGLVYTALTVSLGMDGPLQGAAFMFVFGLGTLPIMFLTVHLGHFMTQKYTQKLIKVLPVVVFVMGVLFIVRGLGLGIPYLSPPKEALEIHAKKACCKKH